MWKSSAKVALVVSSVWRKALSEVVVVQAVVLSSRKAERSSLLRSQGSVGQTESLG